MTVSVSSMRSARIAMAGLFLHDVHDTAAFAAAAADSLLLWPASLVQRLLLRGSCTM